MKYLLAHDPDTLKAGFAINEGGRGELDDRGVKQFFGLQAGEKATQDLTLTATSPGGHSARPRDDNAISRMGAALAKIGPYSLPIDVIDVSRNFFAKMAKRLSGDQARVLAAIGANTATPETYQRIPSANPFWNAYLRTTCIPTKIEDNGYSKNQQPQLITANVNCRILPGQSSETVLKQVRALVADPTVTVEFDDPPDPLAVPPPLTAEVVGPIERIASAMFPGVPVLPSLSTGATDGRWMGGAGIPTYGVSGLFGDPDGNGIHDVNERVRVSSLYDSREFLYRLIREYGTN